MRHVPVTVPTRSADPDPGRGSSYGWASSLCYIGRFGESRRTVAVAPGASVAVFRSLHTHFIELQPSHTLEQGPVPGPR